MSFQAALRGLQEETEALLKGRQSCAQTAEHIKSQAHDTERGIREEFKRLHHFLRDEETARIAALREEEEQKSQMMTERMDTLTKYISSLSDRIGTGEEAMEGANPSSLQNYNATNIRAQCKVADSEMMSGTLIDVAKHQGNLKYRVWEKMLEIVQYTPVILDPNTASPFHYLSEELTSVRYIEMKQHLPENPERFRAFPFILGRDGLGPGRHSWEVEVGESCLWIIGVAKGSINRNGGVAKGSMNCNGAMAEGPGEGPWCIRHSDGRYIGTSLSPTVTETPLAVRRPPRSVRVQLDWDEGELSFTDAANGTLLHTIRGLPITERLFPIFCPSQDSLPLRICTQAMLAARPTPPTLPTQPYQGCDIM